MKSKPYRSVIVIMLLALLVVSPAVAEIDGSECFMSSNGGLCRWNCPWGHEEWRCDGLGQGGPGSPCGIMTCIGEIQSIQDEHSCELNALCERVNCLECANDALDEDACWAIYVGELIVCQILP